MDSYKMEIHLKTNQIFSSLDLPKCPWSLHLAPTPLPFMTMLTPLFLLIAAVAAVVCWGLLIRWSEYSFRFGSLLQKWRVWKQTKTTDWACWWPTIAWNGQILILIWIFASKMAGIKIDKNKRLGAVVTNPCHGIEMDSTIDTDTMIVKGNQPLPRDWNG